MDGDFHFVTSSEKLARRFLETASGQGSLGGSREFRYAPDRHAACAYDTVFIYLSDAMFRNMVSPQYRIETARRLAADADIQLVQLARLDSATEGRPDDTFAQLIEGGFLPPDFGPRSDGSRTRDGPWRDLRFAPRRGGPSCRCPTCRCKASPRRKPTPTLALPVLSIELGPDRPDAGRHAAAVARRRATRTGDLDALMSPLDRQRYDF